MNTCWVPLQVDVTSQEVYTAQESFSYCTKQQMPYDVFYPGKIYLWYKESETHRDNPTLAPDASQ